MDKTHANHLTMDSSIADFPTPDSPDPAMSQPIGLITPVDPTPEPTLHPSTSTATVLPFSIFSIVYILIALGLTYPFVREWRAHQRDKMFNNRRHITPLNFESSSRYYILREDDHTYAVMDYKMRTMYQFVRCPTPRWKWWCQEWKFQDCTGFELAHIYTLSLGLWSRSFVQFLLSRRAEVEYTTMTMKQFLGAESGMMTSPNIAQKRSGVVKFDRSLSENALIHREVLGPTYSFDSYSLLQESDVCERRLHNVPVLMSKRFLWSMFELQKEGMGHLSWSATGYLESVLVSSDSLPLCERVAFMSKNIPEGSVGYKLILNERKLDLTSAVTTSLLQYLSVKK